VAVVVVLELEVVAMQCSGGRAVVLSMVVNIRPLVWPHASGSVCHSVAGADVSAFGVHDDYDAVVSHTNRSCEAFKVVFQSRAKFGPVTNW
jgi:hypothetical protein